MRNMNAGRFRRRGGDDKEDVRRWRRKEWRRKKNKEREREGKEDRHEE